jgi:hypothetical protein
MWKGYPKAQTMSTGARQGKSRMLLKHSGPDAVTSLVCRPVSWNYGLTSSILAGFILRLRIQHS